MNYIPNILVTGSNGYLGSYLSRNLNCTKYIRGDKLPESIDIIINCAGLVNFDLCEKYPNQSYDDNVLFLENLVELYPTTYVIHFSSYYLYDQEGLNEENSKINPIYTYMRHKYESEMLVTNGVVFRLGKLFLNPYLKKGFPDCVLDNPEITIDLIECNPTSVQQVYDVVKWAIEERPTGIFNLANKGIASHLELAIRYFQAFNKTNHNFNIVRKRDNMFSSYGKFLMDLSKLSNYVVLRDWREDVKQFTS